ncbi:MAG: two-component regulator propeller domain-containing protein [Saprospiraceae bacterium]
MKKAFLNTTRESIKYCFKVITGHSGAITRLAVFGNDELWIGTKKDGLIHLSIPENIPVALPSEHALRHNKVISVMKDREGLLWLATNRGQLFSANVRFVKKGRPFSTNSGNLY